MSIPFLGAISTDISIIALIVVMVILGVLLGYGRLKTLAFSAYVGMVVAEQLYLPLISSTKNVQFIAKLAVSTIRVVLFVTPIILLELTKKRHEPSARSGVINTLILAVATSGLLVIGFFQQYSDHGLKEFLGSSALAYIIFQGRLVFIGVVPVLMMLESIIKPRDKHGMH